MMPSVPSHPFHVLAKSAGPACNLERTYCSYLEKDRLYPGVTRWAMSDDVLESFVRQYLAAHQTPEVTFGWQGGEPTLLGIGFFQKVVDPSPPGARQGLGCMIHRDTSDTERTTLEG